MLCTDLTMLGIQRRQSEASFKCHVYFFKAEIPIIIKVTPFLNMEININHFSTFYITLRTTSGVRQDRYLGVGQDSAQVTCSVPGRGKPHSDWSLQAAFRRPRDSGAICILRLEESSIGLELTAHRCLAMKEWLWTDRSSV